jgi:hypothetical protein
MKDSLSKMSRAGRLDQRASSIAAKCIQKATISITARAFFYGLSIWVRAEKISRRLMWTCMKTGVPEAAVRDIFRRQFCLRIFR